MILKLRKDTSLSKKRKQFLVLSSYDDELADKLFNEGEHFWDSTLYFIDDLKKVEWSIENGMFDYLYAPLEKMALIDRRVFKFL